MSNDAKIFHLSFFDLIFYRPYHTNTLFSNTRRPNQLVGPFLVYLLTQCRFNHWLIGSTHNWVNQTRVNLRDSWNPLGSRFNPFCAKPIRSIQLVHEHAHTHTTGFARDQREFTQKKKTITGFLVTLGGGEKTYWLITWDPKPWDGAILSKIMVLPKQLILLQTSSAWNYRSLGMSWPENKFSLGPSFIVLSAKLTTQFSMQQCCAKRSSGSWT